LKTGGKNIINSDLIVHWDIDPQHQRLHSHEGGNSNLGSGTISRGRSVYQKDLGPDTPSIAQSISEFNLDKKWMKVPD